MNNKKTAKILSLVAVLAMVLTMTVALGVSASAVEYSQVDPNVEIVDEVVVTTEDQLKSAIRKNSADDASITNIGPIELADGRKVTLRDGGTIILGADIETNWVFSSTIGVNKSFTLKSAEGHTYTIYRGAKGAPAKTSTTRANFTLQNGATVIVENVVFDGQKDLVTTSSAYGGAFSVSAGTTLILNKGAVIQNYNGTYGGAIYSKGTLVINSGAEISSNKVSGTSARGGGVAVYGGTTYMMGGTVKGNVNHDTSTATNHATYGGGFAVSGGTLYVYGGVIEENQITTATGTNNTVNQYGTAINLSSSGAVYLVGGTIRNNTADNSKGIALGFYSTPSMYIGVPTGVVTFPEGADTPTEEPFILDSTNNYPYELGKSSQIHLTSILPEGSRVYANGNPTIDCTTVAEDAFAGVVHNYSSGVTMFHTAGTPVFENRYSVGGEIYNTYSAALAAAIAAKGTLTFTHDVIITLGLSFNAGEYTVDGAGHSISLLPGKASRVFDVSAGAIVTLTDLKLVGNGTQYDYDGAAIGISDGASLTIGDGTVISGFSGKKTGGAILANGTLIMTGGQITGNIAATNGGAISVGTTGSATISGGEISDNKAVSGAGIYVGGTLTMTAGTIKDNVASSEGGGIAIATTKTADISGGLITSNDAKSGGGIYTAGTLTLSGTVAITNNTSTTTGAGVGISSPNGAGADTTKFGKLIMQGGTISGNTATTNGGGIYGAGRSHCEIAGGEISSNTADLGGGIYFNGSYNLLHTVSGTTITKNNATSGAGIYVGKSVLVALESGEISDNHATNGGGGFYVAGTLNMSGGTISGNTADAFSDTYGGGGIFFDDQGIGNITGGVIENNVAHHGAGIQARYLLTVTGATISGNVARTAGAGIYVVGSAKVEIGEGTAIENNIAAALNKAMYGGGAYVAAGGTLVMNGGRISGNVASDYTASKDSRGAGVYTLGNFWMTGGEISGNVLVGTLGCGVFCGQGNFYMLGGEIRDNVLARYAHTNFPRGSALMLTTNAESAYLLGGTIEGNVIKDRVTVEQSESETVATPVVERDGNGNVISITTYDGTNQYVVTLNETLFEGEGEFAREICIYNVNAKVYIGGSIAGATVPDAIVNNVNGVSVSESVVTSSNALVIPATEKGDTFGYVNGATAEQLILSGALAEGSLVVIPDNYSEEVAYAMTVADDASIGCIFLDGADALYRPTVTEDGKLVWPKEEYQLYQSAALDQSISFRVAFARRNAKADILSDVTVEQITKAQNKETAAWDSKAVNAEWKQDIYNGSPCIVVSLAPKMAMDQIIVKKGDVAVKDEGYTFASYLKAMKENELYSTDTKLMALVDATLNYCAAAQNYFNYNNGTLANVGVDTTVGTIAEVTMSLNDPNKIFYRAQVDVASTVSVAIIAKGNVTATVTVGTTPITPEYQDLKDENGEIYTAIVIPDLTAAALMQDITVEIGDASLTYSVPAYAYNMQEKSDDAELVSIVQALYAYAVAADAYAN